MTTMKNWPLIRNFCLRESPRVAMLVNLLGMTRMDPAMTTGFRTATPMTAMTDGREPPGDYQESEVDPFIAELIAMPPVSLTISGGAP